MDGLALARGNSRNLHKAGQDLASTLTNFPATDLAAVKTPAHYFHAVRRRIWLILVIAVPLAITLSILALRAPRIYQARAEITIEPPELNPLLQALIGQGISHQDPVSQDKYVPNQIAYLQSKNLAEAVVKDPRIASELTVFDDPAQELVINALQVRPVGKTNWYIVLLEGRDPSRTKKVLELLLQKFKDHSELENSRRMDDTKDYAIQRMQRMQKELKDLDDGIMQMLRTAHTIGPNGKNIFEEQYINLTNMLSHKQMRLGELNQQLLIANTFPRADFGDGRSRREEHIEVLEAEKAKWIKVLTRLREIEHPRQFNRDPAVKHYANQLREVDDRLTELKSMKTEMSSQPTQMILEQLKQEIENDREQHQAVLTQMQQSMPDHQRFMSMVEDRKHTQDMVAAMQGKIDAFELLRQSQKEPILIPNSVPEPTIPVRPSRTLYIGMGLILSFGLAISLVVMLEHVDRSVKVPEHVSHGLVLPLLGVVPRIRRTAGTDRAGHLWTPGTPNSLEADAFRNVRASLLGFSDRHGTARTLLVTSPKSGDGKSTTALNLAGTCARAGERTLLIDIDLRRPTLAQVFPPEPAKEETQCGLVDVLQGLLPWQKVLRRTELQNLDFIATGDPQDVPIEILGTLELRQLLAAVASHYDRVILDGPAVLGMADCRMLGRMVDASLLVVRAGAHPLVTLQRAKVMLEQSHVPIAGVIVNNLNDGIQHWSSYDYASLPTASSNRMLVH